MRILTILMLVALCATVMVMAEEKAAPAAADRILGPGEWPEGDAAIPYIRAWIEANGYTHTVGHTSVSNLSNKEKLALRGYSVPEGYVHQSIDFSTIQDPPSRDAWDWRDHGGETVVESQSPCGSCWSFAASHAVAAAYKIGEGVEINVSEQHIIDCNSYGYSCNSGGWMEAAYELFLPGDYGFVLESCYPYIGGDQSCYQASCTPVGHIDSYTGVSNTVSSIKAALATGPVAVAYTVGGSFDYYSGGCFSEEHGSSVNHAMLIVGWDDAMCSGNGAWIVKNSWGTGWGIAGYCYIQYNTSSIGYGADLVHYTPQTPLPNLNYAGLTVDDSAGDGDGYIDPGETVVFEIDLENTGTNSATGVSATISSATSGVTIVDGTALYPSIPVGTTRTSQYPHFTVAFASWMSEGTSVSFDLDISSDQGTYSDSFSVFLGQAIFFDDMESGDNGWTHYQVAAQDDWMRGYPGDNANDPDAPYSGSNLWGNDLAPSGWNGDYYSDVHNYLQSPTIDCSGWEGVTLRYYRWLTVEAGQYDQATIYVNGTQVWQNAYGTDHIDTAWTLHEIDISAIADNNASVVVEFHMESDSGTEYGGWNIDDFGIFGGQGGVCFDDGYEDNDDFAEATDVSEGTTAGLQVCTGDDDYYRIWVDAGSSILYEIDFVHAYGDLDLHLYGPGQGLIDSSTSATDGESVAAGSVGASGYYYAMVTGGGDENAYSLTTTVTAPSDTLHVAIACVPDSGTLPFGTQIWAQLFNDDWHTRTIAGRIDLTLANGTNYYNWKSGATNIAAGSFYLSTIPLTLPNFNAVRGENEFILNGEDVTAAPYNQPPYSPSGDTDEQTATVTGY